MTRGTGRRREPRGVRPEDCLEGPGELAGADPLEGEPEDQTLQTHGFPQLGWQDRRGELSPVHDSWLCPGPSDQRESNRQSPARQAASYARAISSRRGGRLISAYLAGASSRLIWPTS